MARSTAKQAAISVFDFIRVSVSILEIAEYPDMNTAELEGENN